MQTTQIIQEEISILKTEIDTKDKILAQKNHYILQLEEALKQQRHKIVWCIQWEGLCWSIGLI